MEFTSYLSVYNYTAGDVLTSHSYGLMGHPETRTIVIVW